MTDTREQMLSCPIIREDNHGFYFVLSGKHHGHWRSKAEAIAGRKIALIRAKGERK